MSNTSLYAVVVACNGWLICRSLREEDQNPQVNPETGETESTGYTFRDTANTLGVSPEALEIMQGFDRNNEDVGDLNWSVDANGEQVFSWIGTPISAFDPASFVAPRTFEILDYVNVVNDEYLTHEISLMVDIEQKIESLEDPNLTEEQQAELANEIIEEIVEFGFADADAGDDDLEQVLADNGTGMSDEEADEALAEELTQPGVQNNL